MTTEASNTCPVCDHPRQSEETVCAQCHWMFDADANSQVLTWARNHWQLTERMQRLEAKVATLDNRTRQLDTGTDAIASLGEPLEILLPSLGDENAVATIKNIAVTHGDQFDQGQILVELESDDAIFEFPSEHRGTILDILVATGEQVGSGQALFRYVARPDALPEEGEPWTIPDLGLLFLPIAQGSFVMGSENGAADERPPHRVTLKRPFWMSKFPITQEIYQQVASANPSQARGVNLPVETVSWYDAVDFGRRLTEWARGSGTLPDRYVYRLPTEAEWEYACRAGTTDERCGSMPDMAWYQDNSGGVTHPVGEKAANPWGLHDIYGNVWEWCADWYGDYSAAAVADPTGSWSGTRRILRGGCRDSGLSFCRSSTRFSYSPTIALGGAGFRVVLAPQIQSDGNARG